MVCWRGFFPFSLFFGFSPTFKFGSARVVEVLVSANNGSDNFPELGKVYWSVQQVASCSNRKETGPSPRQVYSRDIPLYSTGCQCDGEERM